MKIRFESEDGKVTGYGDEGKAAVEAYEADPWTSWEFPWERSLNGGVYSRGRYVTPKHADLASVAFSKMVPVIEKMVKDADESWDESWDEPAEVHPRYYGVAQLDAILKETLDAGRQ